ncbi:uncharacterized protein A1O9_09079 [Exophiala aquamarina CBS 119918]|uniref:Thioesterase domain-containing protein n=1 Tax=Exophiala aquamarina CBS 119918 TaxID=1182545 RepID=A0A072P4J9_9EURO|nr:uncharacterized protein A1O9_09079 [Exophiala aquamarina CBS 119918]KEF54637.1 hypothetical protein A1O9_09079 [Exophiala aquamarina CBS 119918]
MSPPDDVDRRAVARAKVLEGYDVELMTKLVLLDAEPEGRVVWELEITEFYANQNGVMHGGAAGVIFDMCTTTALCPISRPGYWEFQAGVSRSINISYLRAVPLNTKVHITGRVAQHGRTMALIRGDMTSPDGKTIYATCEHHKVNVPPTNSIDELRQLFQDEIKRRGGDRSWLDNAARAMTVESKL